MEKHCKKLAIFLITLHFYHEFCSAINATTIRYTNIGDNLTLPLTMCRYDISSWYGPCLASTECNITTTIYFDGLMKYPNLPRNINLKTDMDYEEGNYNLQIFNISSGNEGLYTGTCFYNEEVLNREYHVVLRVKPSNLFIENEFDGRIVGTADYQLDLICRVTSGEPLENMTWYQDQIVVQEGGPGMLAYSFIPTPENDGQKFSCVIQSDALVTPMKQTIHLSIRYRPVVKCADELISVVKGNKLTVQCLAHSNPPPTYVRITRHGMKLEQCPHSPCSITVQSSRNDSGIYWCTAYNQIGDGNNCETIVKILYPPAVSVVILNDDTLRCSATAEPNNATYLSWQHINELGEVRQYNGSEYLELCSSCKRYMVNGLYRCSATNGIRDTDDNNISFGNVSVQLKGTPEILPKTKSIQYGKYKKDVALEIFVYSTTMVTVERILRNGEVIDTSGRLVINDSFRNQHKVTYHIEVLREVDFTKYTFEVKNDQGAIKFNVSLVAKDIPETPVIKGLTVKDADITVHFKDTFNGGLQQVYVLQYRSSLNWTSVEVNDTFDGVGSYIIQNLQVGQIYYFRIYSVNSLGKSNMSEMWTTELSSNQNFHILTYVFIGTGIVVLLVTSTLITRKVEAIKTCLIRSGTNEENNSDYDQQGQNMDALVENQMYLAFDSISRNQQQNASVAGPRYVAVQNHGENLMQSRNLHYADLEFNPATQRFVIRGDDRTIYSEIDHSLVAPPLDSSDSEEEDKKNDDDDDFMSVEEVAEYMRERGMKPPIDD